MPVTYGESNREWAEQRAQQQQHYDPITRWVTLAVFATFPRARKILLMCCIWGFVAAVFIFVMGLAIFSPNSRDEGIKLLRVVSILGGFGLGGLSLAAFVGLWIPSTIGAYVAPRMRDRWLGTEQEEEEDE